MDPAVPARSPLAPLRYHREVAAYLRDHERSVWDWAGSQVTDDRQRDALRAALLRETYRLDPAAHADTHALLATALQRLGIAAPATLYQSPGLEMNAALLYVPGEIHITLQGPVLERLTPDELLAVFGHEAAHYLLWSQLEHGALLADRILGDSTAVADAHPSHVETWRRHALHTELYADRGAALAANGVAPAITTLVKIQTGIGSVDPDAYLRQAVEIEQDEQGASQAHTHPETFLRARALAKWWDGDADLEDWLVRRLHGPLSLERLDLPGQSRLQEMTRKFVAHFLRDAGLATDAVLSHVRLMFPDWGADEPAAGPESFGPDIVDDSVRAYLNALLLDLALADPDGRDAALLRAGGIAQALGSMDDLKLKLRRDAGFNKRELDAFQRKVAKEAQA